MLPRLIQTRTTFNIRTVAKYTARVFPLRFFRYIMYKPFTFVIVTFLPTIKFNFTLNLI